MDQTDLTSLLHTIAMAPPPGESGGGFMGFLPMILIFVAFYFLIDCSTKKETKTTPKND